MTKIMVVDDDKMVLTIVAKLLTLSGYDVVTFPDVNQALETAAVDDVDIIITDLAMPVPGEVLIRELKRLGIDIPIIVMSGHVSAERALLLESIGVHEIISKPFIAAEFLKVVEDSLLVN